MTFNSSGINGGAVIAWVFGNGTPTGATGPFYGSSQTWAADTVNCSLWGNNPTTATAQNDTLAHNAYNAAGGQWVSSGNESSATTGYSAGGTALGTKTNTGAISSGVISFGAANPSWTVTGTLTAYGDLVYDNTVTNKYAYCWNYFGGSQSVTGGTFTVQWSSGIVFQLTCTSV